MKSRVKRLLEALLTYIDSELPDTEPLPIAFHWQDENTSNPKLVVETKLRVLTTLTEKDPYEGKLSKQQVQQALSRLQNFWKILSDNSLKTKSKDDRHFTLKLWSRNKQSNLKQLDREWRRRKSQNLQPSSNANTLTIIWKQLDEEAQQLGYLLSLFALAPIPWAQVESVLGQLYLPGALLQKLLDAPAADPQAEIEHLLEGLKEHWEEARTTLLHHHLLQSTSQDNYQLYPPFREFLQEKLKYPDKATDLLKQAFSEVMVAVAKQISQEPTPELMEAVAPAIPHIAEVATHLIGTTRELSFISDRDVIELFEGLSVFYQSQGFYEQAAFWSNHQSLVIKD